MGGLSRENHETCQRAGPFRNGVIAPLGAGPDDWDVDELLPFEDPQPASVPATAVFEPSPEYSAVIVFVPAVEKLVVHAAVAATSVTAPQPLMTAPAFLNAMVPVGAKPGGCYRPGG